jgi:hypothetical protein
MGTDTDLKRRLAEFSANIWNHAEDDFQKTFDMPSPLEASEINAFTELLLAASQVRVGKALGKNLDEKMRQLLDKNPEFVNRLVQMLGLTRNKVLQDIKGHAGSTGIKAKTSTLNAAISDPETWQRVANYFRPRIISLDAALGEKIPLQGVLSAINLVTWPGYIRQERAKRMGHEAERRSAEILHALGIPFEPQSKRLNPLSPDVQINGISFDLVVPSVTAAQVVIKSTVHTANIGQYGESKDNLEIKQALQSLTKAYGKRRPVLVAGIDGVGFYSNRAGLQGVLTTADEFFQFKTIWKLVAIAANRVGGSFIFALPDIALASHKDFIQRYTSAAVTFTRLRDAGAAWIDAGEAKISACISSKSS